MKPNSVFAVVIPAAPTELVASTVMSRTPIPRIHANTVPITASSGSLCRPRAAIAPATTSVRANSPTRSSTLATAAAIAPTNATWLSASPANSCPRRTTNHPTQPHASATNVPAR